MDLKHLPLSQAIYHNSELVFGCMGLGAISTDNRVSVADIQQANEIIDTALSANITLFDHADIYNGGKAEQVFGEVLKTRPALRDSIAIQSKCGIRFEDATGPKRYDLSPDWIVSSVEQSLSRLHIEQLDILLLHRPDPLMEPELIAQAFEQLHQSGKVKYFGVSNMQQHQIAFLSSALSKPLVVNQVELSLKHSAWLDEGVTSGNSGEPAINYGAGTIEYCRKNNIQIQAWGSLCQGLYTGRADEPLKLAEKTTSRLISKLSAEYQVSKEAILLSWLQRHPANIQPVIGTTNIARIRACAEANKVQLKREHWYALWVAARGCELP